MPKRLRVGDVLVIKPGEKIPADGVVLQEGSRIWIHPRPTGESYPRKVRKRAMKSSVG